MPSILRLQPRPQAVRASSRSPFNESSNIFFMKCDVCTEDDGQGIHYHAFIDGKHRWVCENCKKKLKIETEHTDE